jgi:hypothetical protein
MGIGLINADILSFKQVRKYEQAPCNIIIYHIMFKRQSMINVQGLHTFGSRLCK